MRTKPHPSGRIKRLIAIPTLALLSLAGLMTTPIVAAHERDQNVIHRVVISAHDNGTNGASFHGSFSMPRKVPTGLVELRFVNDGSTSHMAQLIRLKPGVSESTLLKRLTPVFTSPTPPQVAHALRELLEIASPAGGANSIGPGAYQDVIERLQPGHYVVVCFDSTDTNVPHFLRGMFQGFWVSDDARAPTVRGDRVSDGVPRSNGTVIEFDHHITVPSVIHESERLLLKINVFDQTHEFALLNVPGVKTPAELLACLTAPPGPPPPGCTLTAPPTDAGGAASIAPGGTHWVELHLKPGDYAALCFVPDIKTGMPHAFMGMITTFTVTK